MYCFPWDLAKDLPYTMTRILEGTNYTLANNKYKIQLNPIRQPKTKILIKVALESKIFEFGSYIRNFLFFHKRDLTGFKNSSIDDWMR